MMMMTRRVRLALALAMALTGALSGRESKRSRGCKQA